ncbi:MAG: DUF5654 family protein [Candidatus Paceibacterota bacterium]|jgi:C4-dicarboxylate transporter
MNEEKTKVKEELKNQTKGYIMAGLGVVAGLAWNDAIRSLIDTVFVFSKDGILVKFLYALLITIVVIVIGRYILKS